MNFIHTEMKKFGKNLKKKERKFCLDQAARSCEITKVRSDFDYVSYLIIFSLVPVLSFRHFQNDLLMFLL